MTAVQIAVSASLAVALARGTALAQPEPDGDRSASGAQPDPGASRPGGRFAVGAGYQPDDGFIASALVAQDNLFGTGQSLALDARLSAHRRRFRLRFDQPHLGDSDVGLHLELHDAQRSWPGFDRTRVGGSLTLDHALGRHTRALFGVRLEDVSLALDPPPAAAPRLALPGSGATGDARLVSSLGAGLIYDTRDAPIDPRRGTDAGAWIEAADPILGGDTRLVRGRLWLEHHHPLGPFTLHLGAAAQAVTGGAGGVPLSQRLWLDGSSELRGYAPASLGPRDPVTGLPLGGTAKLSARAGLELPLWPAAGLSGEVFADAAGVFDLDRGGAGGLGLSAGGGLVWHSPLGPVHLDVAVPLDGGHPVLLLSLGGGF